METKFTELKENRINLRDAIPLQKPFTLLIEPSSICNFNCKMCFQSAKNQGEFANKKGNMSMSCFEKILDQAKTWKGEKFKVLKLCIYGEPFMNPDFIKMLKMAKKAGIAERIETTTNASLLNENVSSQLIDEGLDYLRVSIYGENQRIHEETTKSNTLLENIYNNLAQLQELKLKKKSEKPFVAIKMLDTFSERRNQIFRETFLSVGDEVYLDAPHNWVRPDGEDFIGNLYNGAITEESNGQYACPMPFTTLAVRSNGDIAPCCIDWYGGTVIGNIFKDTLKEAWESKKLHILQTLQLSNKKENNSSCANCNLFSSRHYTIDNIDGVPVDRLLKRGI